MSKLTVNTLEASNVSYTTRTNVVLCDVVVVAGGGSGGGGQGGGTGDGAGGGGAGGVIQEDQKGFVKDVIYNVSVGAGGLGVSATTIGNQGQNSSVDDLVAIGGGAGGGSTGTGSGGHGGSGGGASNIYSTSFASNPGLPTPKQGHAGGHAWDSTTTIRAGSGGGGAGSSGNPRLAAAKAGDGGHGISTWAGVFAAGGGGGADGTHTDSMNAGWGGPVAAALVTDPFTFAVGDYVALGGNFQVF